MQLEVGGDDGGGKFGVSGCAGAGAPYARGDVVQFFAVLLKGRLVGVVEDGLGLSEGPCLLLLGRRWLLCLLL